MHVALQLGLRRNGNRINNSPFGHHQLLAIQDLTSEQRADLLEKSRKNRWSLGTVAMRVALQLGLRPQQQARSDLYQADLAGSDNPRPVKPDGTRNVNQSIGVTS
jgi:hypothetical protein